MRLQQYILTEGSRGDVLSKDEAKSYILKNCKQAMKSIIKGEIIYRGTKGSGSYLKYDPKKGKPRKSANTSNYYTLLIDNSPNWRGFPKRSESLICTTSYSRANSYGDKSFVVIPFDGARIAIAPDEDFWFSFDDNIPMNLSFWNELLVSMFVGSGIPINDKTYSGIVKSFKTFDKMINSGKLTIQDVIENSISNIRSSYQKDYEWFEKEYKGNLLNLINDILHPHNNDFRMVKIGQSYGCDRCEVWTDSKCILVEWKPYGKVNPADELFTELGLN